MADLDLSGTWRAAQAEGDLHKRFVEREFRDDDWIAVGVPGHWRSTGELAETDGPVLYRREFSSEATSGANPEDGRRFLVLDGVFYFADVWLDGSYLGATEGYFTPHAFEITEQLAAAREHVVAIEVACPRQVDRTTKRLVTGVFSHWDTIDTRWNPGGLWRRVHVDTTGPVRIARLRCVCVEATEARGRLLLDLTLDAVAPRAGRLAAHLTGPGIECDAERELSLAAGENHLSWMLEVETPPLWWPRRLGDQLLCDLTVRADVEGQPSDERSMRVGFREVRVDRWIFHVNGERLFVMGSNQGPSALALGEAPSALFQRDVALAVAANLDMLRVHAHVTRAELYDAADEAGLLVWQDMPLQWGYARGIRREAATQAREMVDLLAHHPSIVIWCGHNEPLALEIQPGEPVRPWSAVKLGASMFLPTWNKNVLDRSVHRAIEKADPSRPVDPHSGVLPGPLTGGTDSHLYFGWYHGEVGGLGPALRRWPRLARFVTEFGAQAVPTEAPFIDAARWPELDWSELLERHALQKLQFDRYVPPEDYPTFVAWQQATQDYQAALIQLQCEDLRRLKYAPAGGFLHFCFADANPAASWSVLDDQRHEKRGFLALRDACRPVLPMLEPRKGAVHVANELRRPLVGARVTVRVDGRETSFEGDVPADGVGYVGTVALPDAPPRAAEVVLEHARTGTIVNRYGATILARGREQGLL